jgi:GTP-binding protein HflX
MEEEIETVEGVLVQLGLKEIPALLVLNKSDLLNQSDTIGLCQTGQGITISAIDKTTFQPLLSKIEEFLWSH